MISGIKYRLSTMVQRTSNVMRAMSWPDYSRLFLVGDNADWVLSWEQREIATIAQKLGIRCETPQRLAGIERQSIFYASAGLLLSHKTFKRDCRIGAAMFHGRPGEGDTIFDERYKLLCQYHEKIVKLQVSNHAFREVVLESGIAPDKVFLIPIGVNLSFFSFQSAESKKTMREVCGLPQSAAIIGSFQKDGNGWGEGLEPKLVKGPDIFLKSIEILKSKLPELFVLLSGPSRGYVKTGLEKLGVPYKHLYLDHYPEIGQLYQCLDAYIVASRDEGGPKAILESMACGIPLISTKVGQAVDLIEHGCNGWLCDIEDAETLAYFTAESIIHRQNITEILKCGRKTAELNSYQMQMDQWREFFSDFVSMSMEA